MNDADGLKRELAARYAMAERLDDEFVLSVIRVHVPQEDLPLFQAWCQARKVPDQILDEIPSEANQGGKDTYVLVMDWQTGSLADAIARERLAGINIPEIWNVTRSVALALYSMHSDGVLHGDVKPKNIMFAMKEDMTEIEKKDASKRRHSTETSNTMRMTQNSYSSGFSIGSQAGERVWKLIDLDSAVPIGADLSGKYSEAYIPPEYAKVLLPTRSDGRPVDGQPVMKSSIAHDVWSFGMILFELCSGAELFPRDLNDDTLLWDEHNLATWIEPSTQQLSLVFKPAYIAGHGSVELQMVARDLIMKCLQGDPRGRPVDMGEVLAHLFFNIEDPLNIRQASVERPLPHADRGDLDVIFSYRTLDTAEMIRLRLFFNSLGIRTADGSQVPPGRDWRTWYFNQMRKAKVFVPLLSRHYISGPCYSESIQSKRLKMPTVAVLLDGKGWNRLLDHPVGEMEFRHREPKPGMVKTKYDISEMVDQFRSIYRDPGKPVVPCGDGEWPSPTGDFFEDMCRVAKEIIKILPRDDKPPIYALILTAPAQFEFGETLMEKLNAHGLAAVHVEDMQGWAARPECERCFSILPVLSQEFWLSVESYQVMQRAHECGMDFVPVTHSLESFCKLQWSSWEERALHAGLNERMPYLNSLFNRANRIPPNENFNMKGHMQQLQDSLILHATADRSQQALFAKRVAKMNSLLGTLTLLPTTGSFEPREHMQLVCDEVSNDDRRNRSNKVHVIISHAGSALGVEAAQVIHDALSARGHVVYILAEEDPLWFARCEEAQVCIALLSANYLKCSTPEGQLTFAKDNGKLIVPVVIAEDFHELIKGKVEAEVINEEPMLPVKRTDSDVSVFHRIGDSLGLPKVAGQAEVTGGSQARGRVSRMVSRLEPVAEPTVTI